MKKTICFVLGVLLVLAFAQCHKDEVKEVPFETFEAIVNDSVSQILQEVVVDDNVYDALPALANRLMQMEAVETAEVRNHDVFITFTDGMQHIILFRVEQDQEWPADPPFANLRKQAETSEVGKGNMVGDKKVIVWEPFNLEAGDNAFLSLMPHLHEAEGIDAKYVSFQQCDIASLDSLVGNDYVIIHTHGAEGGDWMATREFVTLEKNRQYHRMLRDGLLRTVTIERVTTPLQTNRPANVYAVSGDYIRSLQGRFDNSIIYGGFCHSMEESGGLRNAFLEKGTGAAFVGFNGSVWNFYNVFVCTYFSEYLIADRMSAGEAYDATHGYVPDYPLFDDDGNVEAPNEFRWAAAGNRDARLFMLPDIPTNNLVAYYPFSGNADDASGHGNNGLLSGQNVPVLTVDRKGRIDNAYEFGGYYNPNWIRVPNSESLQFDKELTISLWLQHSEFAGMDGWGSFSTTGPGFAALCKAGDGNACFPGLYITTGIGADGEGLHISTNNSNGNAHNHDNWNHDINYDFATYQLGDWVHIALVVNDIDKVMYVNGREVAQDEVDKEADFSSMNQQDLYIGVMAGRNSGFGWGGGFWYPFNGKIDDIRIYNRALSVYEVKALARE